MSSTLRNVVNAGVVVSLPGASARKARRERDFSGDPKPKPISVSSLRRQREADEAVAVAEQTYGVRITG